jgi:hypothetical protein
MPKLTEGSAAAPVITGWRQLSGETMKWIGGIFFAALVAISFEIYSDAAMTRCVPGSFFAMVKVCSPGPK